MEFFDKKRLIIIIYILILCGICSRGDIDHSKFDRSSTDHDRSTVFFMIDEIRSFEFYRVFK